MKMELQMPVGDVERRQLAYSKYLLFEGNKHLTSSTLSHNFNVSVILFANALEIVLRVLAYCYNELKGNRNEDTAHNLLTRLGRMQGFPVSDFDSVFSARNNVYHSASLLSWATCRDKRDITIRAFRVAVENFLGEDYDSISLVSFVSDEGIRKALKGAEDELRDDHYMDSVVSSCEGLERLKERVLRRSREHFKDGNKGVLFDTEVSWGQVQRLIGRNVNITRIPGDDIDSLLRMFSKHIEEQVNRKLINVLRLVDFELLLGDSYEDYKHFMSTVPSFHLSTGSKISYDREAFEKRNLTREDAEFAFNFVLTVTLDLESKVKPINKRNLNQDIRSTID